MYNCQHRLVPNIENEGKNNPWTDRQSHVPNALAGGNGLPLPRTRTLLLILRITSFDLNDFGSHNWRRGCLRHLASML